MKQNQLKKLLKHIISEVSSQTEMIANKDVEPDVFGAVNVEESEVGQPHSDKTSKAYMDGKRAANSKVKHNPYTGDLAGYWEAGYNDGKEDDETDNVEEGLFDFNNDVALAAKSLFGKIKKITKTSHPSSNSEYFTISFEIPGNDKIIRKDKSGKLFLMKKEDGKLISQPLNFGKNEQSVSGGAGAYSTPFAFAPTRKKKKKKHVKEGSFLNKIRGSTDTNKKIATEKTLPDGRYVDNMEDPHRSNKVARLAEDDDLNEMTGTSAVAGYQVPGWGSKNRLGSTKGIKGSEKLGYKVVKSITDEGK